MTSANGLVSQRLDEADRFELPEPTPPDSEVLRRDTEASIGSLTATTNDLPGTDKATGAGIRWTRRGVLALLGCAGVISGVGGTWLARLGGDGGRTQPLSPAGNASFGNVAVVSWTSGPRPAAANPVDHGGHSSAPAGTPMDSPGKDSSDGLWTDQITLMAVLTNSSAGAVLVSGGQFRLRIGADGPTVTPYEVSSAFTTVPPGSTETLVISYLAPPDIDPPTLLFDDFARPADPAVELHLAPAPHPSPAASVTNHHGQPA